MGYETLTELNIPYNALTSKKLKIPVQAMKDPGERGTQISRQSAHECVKVIRPTHRPPSPPRNYSWYSFLLEAESTPGS